MIKIIQICPDIEGSMNNIDTRCYGLSDEGKLYYWCRKKIDCCGGEKYIYGWVEMVDEINKDNK